LCASQGRVFMTRQMCQQSLLTRHIAIHGGRFVMSGTEIA